MFTDKLNTNPAVYNGNEYYGYPDRAAEFYLDTHLLPVTPHTFKINNNNANESDQLVDGNPITIAKLDKAQNFSMEFLFLHDQRFFRNTYSSFVTKTEEDGRDSVTWFEIKDLTDYLYQKKQDREPVVLTILYPNQQNLNLKALLDDYSYTQSADNASDYDVSLTFTEFHEALNQEVDVELQNTLIRHNLRTIRNPGGEDTGFSAKTYETETGKHSMDWEEMKALMDHWLNTEYQKTHDGADMPSFEEAFKEWWESDPDRKDLPRPETPKELGYWWNDFIEKSEAEANDNQALADLQAWLNVEVGKLTEEPPENFWEKFILWWGSDETRRDTMHCPNTDEELLNWWREFSEESRQQQQREQDLSDIRDWLNNELHKITDDPPQDLERALSMWWNSEPRPGTTMPGSEEELLNWWHDFKNKGNELNAAMEEIEAWLNVEVGKLTKNPPDTFREKLQLWWNSEDRGGMTFPGTDQELLNWWKDFKDLQKQEAADKEKMAEIEAWLNHELEDLVFTPPAYFWEGFFIWWKSDPSRQGMHCPDTEPELFAWWDDFCMRRDKWYAVKAWLQGELKRPLSTDFWTDFTEWWNSDDRGEMHKPDTEEELFAWWDDFRAKDERWERIKAWLAGELKRLGIASTNNFWTDYQAWWASEDRGDMHCPDNVDELYNWWDDFISGGS